MSLSSLARKAAQLAAVLLCVHAPAEAQPKIDGEIIVYTLTIASKRPRTISMTSTTVDKNGEIEFKDTLAVEGHKIGDIYRERPNDRAFDADVTADFKIEAIAVRDMYLKPHCAGTFFTQSKTEATTKSAVAAGSGAELVVRIALDPFTGNSKRNQSVKCK